MEDVKIEEYLPDIYMEYAASTIIDRALPDVRDGLKPVHRRILYAMYPKMKYNTERVKSTAPVSETMKIHHHGDTSIYESLALLTEQNGTLLHPFIDGEGAFGDVFSKDKPSAQRYTSCRLNEFSMQMFKDIDKNVVRLIGGEDGYYQAEVLPNTFPNILIKPNEGIAVGQSCYSPSFNLKEVCELAINVLQDKEVYPIVPDFSSCGEIIDDQDAFNNLLNVGEATITLVGKWRIKTTKEKRNIIEIYEIPYNTTIPDIVNKIKELMMQGKLKDVTDVRDETGFNPELNKTELLIAIDIKRSADSEKIMNIISNKTPFCKTMAIKMNFLDNNTPRIMGVKETLDLWIKFRMDCVKKAWMFDLNKLEEEYKRIRNFLVLMNEADEAINLIRLCKSDKETVKLFVDRYFISENEAKQLVNDTGLIHLNQENLKKKQKRYNELTKEKQKLKQKLDNDKEIKKEIISQLQYCIDKYSKPRQTQLISKDEVKKNAIKEIEEYTCYIVATKGGYIKKNMRYSEDQKVKDGDTVSYNTQSNNTGNILVFTDKNNMYTLSVSSLENSLPSSLGQYLPSLLGLPDEEHILNTIYTEDYQGNLIICYSNGKVAKVKLSSFKTNRNKLTNVVNKGSILICEDVDDLSIFMMTNNYRGITFNTSELNTKDSRKAQGSQIFKLRNNLVTYTEIITEANKEQYQPYFIKTSGFGKGVGL